MKLHSYKYMYMATRQLSYCMLTLHAETLYSRTMHIEILLQIKLRQETENEGPEATTGGNPWHGSQFYMYSMNLNKIVL